MNIHFDYLAIAALTSILTAIPLFLMALLVGSNHTQRQTPPSKAATEPEPERWEPSDYDEGYHWEPTADDGDPYSYKRVRNGEVSQ